MRRTDLAARLEELRNRIQDELKSRQFLYIPPSKAVYWENEELFGEEVLEAIPEAREDIGEACSCLAVGRNQASVYHCIGIMQAALFKLAEHLSTASGMGFTLNLDVDDWGSVGTKIHTAVDKLRERATLKGGDPAVYAAWKAQEPVYAELESDLTAVKKAWRHTIAHYRQRYTAGQAQKVLDRVRDFVRQVASLLALT